MNSNERLRLALNQTEPELISRIKQDLKNANQKSDMLLSLIGMAPKPSHQPPKNLAQTLREVQIIGMSL